MNEHTGNGKNYEFIAIRWWKKWEKVLSKEKQKKMGEECIFFPSFGLIFSEEFPWRPLEKEARTKEAPNVRAVRLRERAREIEWNEVKLYLKRVTLARIP